MDTARHSCLIVCVTCSNNPHTREWHCLYLSSIRILVVNSSLNTNQMLSKVNHNYRGPLRQLLISVKDDMPVSQEPISGTSSFTRLQLVPSKRVNIIFIAFHTNPIDGHLNAYRTPILPSTSILLARDVCLRKTNETGMSRLCVS
jgi:hypothetical protein